MGVVRTGMGVGTNPSKTRSGCIDSEKSRMVLTQERVMSLVQSCTMGKSA